MHGKLTALALSSLLASVQAAAIPRRGVADAEAVAEILPDGTALATAFLPDEGLLASAIVARDSSGPLAGILSIVNGILDGLDPLLGADAVNATEAALATLAGLLIVTNPDAAAPGEQAKYVMAASTNSSTPLFLVPANNAPTSDAASTTGKTLVTIHVPILDETSGKMADSCLTYDQDPTSSSTLAAMPCTSDTEHASQRFMYDSSTGVVVPMFQGADAMDLATQGPSYKVNAANINADSAPAANASNVLIVFTPATDSVPMAMAALPLTKVAAVDTGSDTMASADDGSATATANGVTASTSGDGTDSEPTVQNDGDDDMSTDAMDTSDDQSAWESDMPSEMDATEHSNKKNKDEEECEDDADDAN